jgi:hypothetical protein
MSRIVIVILIHHRHKPIEIAFTSCCMYSQFDNFTTTSLTNAITIAIILLFHIYEEFIT